MIARLSLILIPLLLAGCGGGVSILPEPFTRERADGKIPVKRELIRQQVQRELAGMPEGEAEVARWQAIEADYNDCRLLSGKAKTAKEQVFAKCMSDRNYVYMYPLDAEQLHNDIEFEIDKAHRERIAAEKKAEEERIAAARKAEEERIAAEKKRQEEAERIRRQKELDTALVVALNRKHYADFAEIKRLIDDGADVNKKSKQGLTPLHHAAYNGETKAVIAFIKAGADIEAKSNKGWTALHNAAYYGQTETANVLIKAGADIEAKENDGRTPLYYAAGNGQTETADALIKAGADIDAKQNDGGTPLHIAAFNGQTETALALIKAGADIGEKTNDGLTPLHVAAGKGKTKIARAFVKAGASLLVRTNSGHTPLDIAIQVRGEDSKIALFLQEVTAKRRGKNRQEEAKRSDKKQQEELLKQYKSICDHEARQYADKRGEGYQVDFAWTIHWHGNYNSAYSSCMARLKLGG